MTEFIAEMTTEFHMGRLHNQFLNNVRFFVCYVIYGTQAVVSRLIQHLALPHAVSASQPHPLCHMCS